jgi:hypothetical protein
MAKKRNACRILIGKPEGKRSLLRTWCRLEDNSCIKIGCREVEWGGMDWASLAPGRENRRVLVNTVMRTFRFHKMLGISWVPAQLTTSEWVLSSMELVRNSWISWPQIIFHQRYLQTNNGALTRDLKANVLFKIVFTGRTGFTVYQYSEMNNSLQGNKQFRF